MDNKVDKPKRRWPTYLAVVFVVLVLVIYPLSIGPAYVVVQRAQIDSKGKFIDVFYYPLFTCVEKTGMAPAMREYIKWWFRITKTPSWIIPLGLIGSEGAIASRPEVASQSPLCRDGLNCERPTPHSSTRDDLSTIAFLQVLPLWYDGGYGQSAKTLGLS